MRRTTPDLVGTRKTIYSYVSVGLLALTVGYVLWTNYVVFVGGNLPLTPISLGTGSTGAGLTMLCVGDLIAVVALWFVIDGVVLRLVDMALRPGNPKEPTPTPPANAQQWEAQGWQQQGQPPVQQQWQPQGQEQWQPQGQQQWQPQGQQQWQPQWQPLAQQPQQQPQPQAWPTNPPPPPSSAPTEDGSGRGGVVTQNPVVQDAYGVNDAGPVHRHWTPPPR